MAVLPAVCEEALHRGFILSSLKPIKNVAFIVIINGVLFGLFHLDIYRFLPTAMLGCAFAYIAIKTDSMILTMLFHFLNNLLSVISMFAAEASGALDADAALSGTAVADLTSFKLSTVLGVSLIYIAIGTVLLFIGVCMLNHKAPKTVAVAIMVAAVIALAVTGVIITAVTSVSTVSDVQGTYNVTRRTVRSPLT